MIFFSCPQTISQVLCNGPKQISSFFSCPIIMQFGEHMENCYWHSHAWICLQLQL